MECIYCKNTIPVFGISNIEVVHCNRCFNLFDLPNKTLLKKCRSNHVFYIKVGTKLHLDFEEYVITGIVEKKTNEYHWIEYNLRNTKNGSYVYLCESDWNWIVYDEVPNEIDLNVIHSTMIYNDQDFKLDENLNDVKIVNVGGVFDYKFDPNIKQQLIEYTCPPYIISLEVVEKEQNMYFGKFIDHDVIKNAIEEVYIPAPTKPFYLDPYKLDILIFLKILGFFGILICCLHFFLNFNKFEQTLFNEQIVFSDSTVVEIISPSFELKGTTSPLVLKMETDSYNSWVNCAVSLVNEKNNEVEFLSKDMEYYAGNDDEGSWTEGTNSDIFKICNVKSGKYHIIIEPFKDATNYQNTYLKLKVSWGKIDYSNFIFVLVILLLAGVLATIFYLHVYEDYNFYEN